MNSKKKKTCIKRNNVQDIASQLLLKKIKCKKITKKTKTYAWAFRKNNEKYCFGACAAA